MLRRKYLKLYTHWWGFFVAFKTTAKTSVPRRESQSRHLPQFLSQSSSRTVLSHFRSANTPRSPAHLLSPLQPLKPCAQHPSNPRLRTQQSDWFGMLPLQGDWERCNNLLRSVSSATGRRHPEGRLSFARILADSLLPEDV